MKALNISLGDKILGKKNFVILGDRLVLSLHGENNLVVFR